MVVWCDLLSKRWCRSVDKVGEAECGSSLLCCGVVYFRTIVDMVLADSVV